jgi:Icc-related predicted phosphoesterase
MNLRILSDLHFEFHPDQGRGFVKSLRVDADEILVLAGDLATPKLLLKSLEMLCDRFRHVIFVAGNHEYYGRAPDEVHRILSEAVQRHANLHWLESAAVTVDEQRFVGATLWFGEEAGRMPGRHFLNDFAVIDDFEPWVYAQHDRAVAFLNRTIRGTDVVITHHLPSQKCVLPKWQGSPLNPFFVHDLEPLILARQPKLWVHGHTHSAVDVTVGLTRIVANPLGYVGQEAQDGFVERLVVEV